MAKTKGKAAPVVEPDEDLDIEAELDELDEDEVLPAPKKSAKKAAPVEDEEEDEDDEDEEPAPKQQRKRAAADTAETSTYNSAWLAEYVNEQCDKNYNPAAMRVLLRKLARAGKLGRNVGEDKSRYDFTGPQDPIVKLVVKAVREGVLDKARKEALDALKEKAAAKKAAAAEVSAKKSGKKATAPEPDEDEDEVETPAPRKKATRRR